MTGTALSGSNADIRAYAMSLPLGMHYVTTTAETVNVPSGYNYCAGYILKRSNTSIMIALFNGDRVAQCTYSTDTWLGWRTTMLDTDLTGINYIANLSSINGLTAPGTYTVNGNGAYGKSGMPSDIATSGILVNYVSLGKYYAQDIICNGIRYSRCSPGTPLTSSHGWLKYTTGGITSVSAI